MGKLILVTGGTRSGKSAYALGHCEQMSGNRCFVATCPVVDPEMEDRILAHREERRGRGWHSLEEETELASLLDGLSGYDTVLIDCLTLWVNNLLFRAGEEGEHKKFGEPEMRMVCEQLLDAVHRFNGTVCCVSNEVGLGIVPDNPMARLYRDLVGGTNRRLAAAAEEVYLVSCGIPLPLKKLTAAG